MLAGLGRRDADVPGNGLCGRVIFSPKCDFPRGGIDLGDPQPGVGELVGEKPETRDDRRPAPVLRLEGEELDLEHVARLGALDEHRAAHGVHMAEVELRHILDT